MPKFILPFGWWFSLALVVALVGVAEKIAWNDTLGSRVVSTGVCADARFMRVGDAQIGMEITVDGRQYLTTDREIILSYLEKADLGTVTFQVLVSGDVVAAPKGRAEN